MRNLVFAIALALPLLVVPAAGRVADAQQAFVVQSDEPRNEFPRGVTFAITFSASSAPKEVRVAYNLAPDGTGATAIAACTGTATVSCTYTLTSGRGISIIPGANITYHWEITDQNNARTSTPSKLYVHEDTRFTFKTLEQDNVTVYYHAGLESQAPRVLDAAAQTLRDVGTLEKTQVTFPVKVFLYATADEMQPAIAPNQSRDRGVQILGEVVYSDTAMVSADVSTIDITRHEVAHIVTELATKGPFGVASWLNEGISVHSQNTVLASHASALQSAIRRDAVLSMRELNSSSSGQTGDTVSLFYGESGAIVSFLIDTYGADKFADLLKTFKDGATPDKAFQQVYGFDQLGIENEWRKSAGLQPRAASAASASPTSSSDTASRAQPTSPSDPRSSSSDSSSDSGTSVLTISIIVALALAALAAAIATVALVRRRL